MAALPTTFELPSRTVHLSAELAEAAAVASPPSIRKGLRLTDLRAGDTARVLRLGIPDAGCRKRFAELGLAEGMKVTVASTGDTLMLIIGGSRMGLAARCAEGIHVARISG
jgi:Fe2+ transport system protein FeoA